VIVSQWATVLQLIELQIKKKGIKYTAITGSVKTEDRYQNNYDHSAFIMTFNQAILR
jgi:SNF2 family DNA or RNA helicase